MSDNELVKAKRVVGEGSTQLLCETHFYIDPPLAKVLEQRFKVVVTDYTVFVDKVMFKGLVEKSLIYKHPHLRKKNDRMENEANKGDGNKDEGRGAATYDGKNYDAKKEGNEKFVVEHDGEKKDVKIQDIINKDDLHCSQGWCIRLDSNDGIVHFYEEILQFTGIVNVCGVMPDDNCCFSVAEVRDYEAIVPTKIDKNGLVRAASQMFIITVEVNVTRSKEINVKTDKKCENE